MCVYIYICMYIHKRVQTYNVLINIINIIIICFAPCLRPAKESPSYPNRPQYYALHCHLSKETHRVPIRPSITICVAPCPRMPIVPTDTQTNIQTDNADRQAHRH